MSADKRTVSTDALATLGTIIGPNEKRDAIHLAVIPVKAAVILLPGQSIIYKDGEAHPDHRGIGIVDPFLRGPVRDGETFWMVLRPRLITSLRHVWTHPDLPDEPGAEARAAALPDKAVSEAWLRDFCAKSDCPSYQTVMAALQGDFGEDGGYIDDDAFYFSGRDAHDAIPPEFWTHAEIVLGRTFTNKPAYFSCSC